MAVSGFDTDVPETEECEREILLKELEGEYVGWQPPPKRAKDDDESYN